jgi:hypothetical protein
MGIMVVLIVYAIALIVAASLAALVLGLFSYRLTKFAGPKHRKAVLASVVFPFLCVAFAGGWLSRIGSSTPKCFTVTPV